MIPGPGETAWGVYVHVPWCKRRCPYCAFYVEVERAAPFEAYVDRALANFAARRADFPSAPPVSVFLGGGTPSRLPGPALARLLAGIPRVEGAEVSAETNPEDADAAWLSAALEAGVNRLSLGLQTMNPGFARLLNRGSSVRAAAETARRVGAAGFRSWSADFIFALPGQTLADLDADLEAILALEPPHISLYGLTFEPGTPLTRARDEGRLQPVDDELWREMYDRLVDRLAHAGLHRYEVSNFARPGHESAHNRLYWSDAPYLGVGPGAHSYSPEGARWVERPEIGAWLDLDDSREDFSPPSPEGRAVDLLVSATRGVEGTTEARLRARSGLRLAPGVLAGLKRAGMLVDAPGRIALAHAGFPVADAVIRRLVDALEAAPSPDTHARSD